MFDVNVWQLCFPNICSKFLYKTLNQVSDQTSSVLSIIEENIKSAWIVFLEFLIDSQLNEANLMQKNKK